MTHITSRETREIRETRDTVVSKEPWPASGIELYKAITDGPWGYLLVHADGRFEFDAQSQPSREEILARWSMYLPGETELPQSSREKAPGNRYGQLTSPHTNA